jgi:cation diffusion facilitator family transporter
MVFNDLNRNQGMTMSAHCHDCQAHDDPHRLPAPGYRRVLWIALLINAVMFGVEIVAGLSSGSVSLLADAIDFFGDAANYGVTLAVLSLGLVWRARAALLKSASMIVFGGAVLVKALWSMSQGVPPEPLTMGLIGALALAANLVAAALLYAYRAGDANMRGVWLCTRNDAIGNLAVMLAALGVFGTGTAWPDLAVAMVMAGLAISSGWTVMRQAGRELAWAR